MAASSHQADRDDIAGLLRESRKHSALTQRELGIRAQVSQPVIAAYESGRRHPTVATLRRLLAAAGHDLVIGALPQKVPARDKQVMAGRSRILTRSPGHYRSLPENYLSLLRTIDETDRLRLRRGLPPLPIDDDPAALRGRAHRLGLLDAQTRRRLR